MLTECAFFDSSESFSSVGPSRRTVRTGTAIVVTCLITVVVAVVVTVVVTAAVLTVLQ